MEGITYTIKFLTTSLEDHLRYAFPDQQILPEELDSLMQGLVNSLRWATLRSARKNQEKGQLFKLEKIETVDHFCTDQMSKKEIIKRLENTSGLGPEVCLQALSFIEQKIDSAIFPQRSAQNEINEMRVDSYKVHVEHIGVISGLEPSTTLAHEQKRYMIELDKALSIKPKVRAIESI